MLFIVFFFGSQMNVQMWTVDCGVQSVKCEYTMWGWMQNKPRNECAMPVFWVEKVNDGTVCFTLTVDGKERRKEKKMK